MNCRDSESLILAERDGVLTNEQHAALASHLAACPACRQLQAALGEATDFLKTDAANVPVPDVDREWRTLQAQLAGEKLQPTKKRRLAPVIWFGAPLAAAAAVAFLFIDRHPEPAPMSAGRAATVASTTADETPGATMAYVDQDSGWLVVWSTDAAAKGSG